MIVKARGIILNNSDYRDNDLLCHILFAEYGLLTFVVKGAKKLTSKNAFGVNRGTISEITFDYKENRKMFSIQRADYIESYYYDDDLIKLTTLNMIFEIAGVVSKDQDVVFELYDLLNKTLLATREYDILQVLALYIAKIMKLVGIEPYVDGCVLCNASKVVAISKEKGGFLCEHHALNLPKDEVRVLKKFRLINKMDFEHLNLLKDLDYNWSDTLIMLDFLTYNSVVNVKSYRFLKSLLKDL